MGADPLTEKGSIDRARQLVEPYCKRLGVVGIYLAGSATRPHQDEWSDLDIEVIVEDSTYADTPDEERHVYVLRSSKPPVVDYEIYLIPWSDFMRLPESSHDLFHYPYQHVHILFDPQARLAPMIERLRMLPSTVRRERMIVHYLGALYALAKARRVSARAGSAVNRSLLYGDALRSLCKCLFLLHGSWPSTPHWTMEELRLLGVPYALLTMLEQWAEAPSGEASRAVVKALDEHLTSAGEVFHQDRQAIGRWLLFTEEGKAAFERWGSR